MNEEWKISVRPWQKKNEELDEKWIPMSVYDGVLNLYLRQKQEKDYCTAPNFTSRYRKK
jgi:hypothetical protein